MGGLLYQILLKRDYTKVIASHDLDMILDTCDRTVVLKEGQIFADGNTQDILLDNDLMQECDLELPLSCQKRNFNCKITQEIKEQYEKAINGGAER